MAEKGIKLNRSEPFISFEKDGGPLQIGNIRIIFDKKNDVTSFKIFYCDFSIYDTNEKKINVSFLTEEINPISFEHLQNIDKITDKKILDILDVLASIKSFKESPYNELEIILQISFDEIITVFTKIEFFLRQYIIIPEYNNSELIGNINPETKILESPYFYNSYIPQSSDSEIDKEKQGQVKKYSYLFILYPRFFEHFEFLKKDYIEETQEGFLHWKKSKKCLSEYFNEIKSPENKSMDWKPIEKVFNTKGLLPAFKSNGKTHSIDFGVLSKLLAENFPTEPCVPDSTQNN
ncbi:hypothetical protein AGMMS49546_38840 [Spirochaetia bacterium]|nr:hypothetical protein AGMMS49546_38840 [Spirochaetia bacterium]